MHASNFAGLQLLK